MHALLIPESVCEGFFCKKQLGDYIFSSPIFSSHTLSSHIFSSHIFSSHIFSSHIFSSHIFSHLISSQISYCGGTSIFCWKPLVFTFRNWNPVRLPRATLKSNISMLQGKEQTSPISKITKISTPSPIVLHVLAVPPPQPRSNAVAACEKYTHVLSPTAWKMLNGLCTGTLGTLSALCAGHLSNSACYLHANHPELHLPSEPEPSGLISHLHKSNPEAYELSATMP